MLWVQLAICVGLIVAASSILSRYADVIAEKTGLGRALAGVILLSSITVLPELVSGTTAVTVLQAPNLAIGGIVGSILFNLLLIAIMDIAYQPGSILARAQDGHILAGGLGILLIGLAAITHYSNPMLQALNLVGVSAVSVVIFIIFAVGTRLLATFQRKRAAEVLEQEAEVLHYERISAHRAYLMFAGAAVVVVITGVWLASLTDQIAAETGLGRSFVGALFLGVSTSLTEITATLTAVRLGAIDLAIGNVLGANLFNVVMLAVYDVFDGGTNLWASMSNANALGLIIAMMMTAVVIISLMYRASPNMRLRINWDGAALIAMYLGAMAALYALG